MQKIHIGASVYVQIALRADREHPFVPINTVGTVSGYKKYQGEITHIVVSFDGIERQRTVFRDFLRHLPSDTS